MDDPKRYRRALLAAGVLSFTFILAHPLAAQESCFLCTSQWSCQAIQSGTGGEECHIDAGGCHYHGAICVVVPEGMRDIAQPVLLADGRTIDAIAVTPAVHVAQDCRTHEPVTFLQQRDAAAVDAVEVVPLQLGNDAEPPVAAAGHKTK